MQSWPTQNPCGQLLNTVDFRRNWSARVIFRDIVYSNVTVVCSLLIGFIKWTDKSSDLTLQTCHQPSFLLRLVIQYFTETLNSQGTSVCGLNCSGGGWGLTAVKPHLIQRLDASLHCSRIRSMFRITILQICSDDSFFRSNGMFRFWIKKLIKKRLVVS